MKSVLLLSRASRSLCRSPRLLTTTRSSPGTVARVTNNPTKINSSNNRQGQQQSLSQQPRRSFGGGGHGGKKDTHHPEEHGVHEHHHHHHDHHPEPQSMQAVLWQGHPVEPEGWERTVYITYAAAAVLLGLTLGFSPDTNIRAWAEGEARARLDMQAQGTLETPVFGTHYNTVSTQFAWESKIVDDPFDEDEEEEEEEKEENEEEKEDDEEEEEEE